VTENAPASAPENFEDLVWLFRCDSRNRGIIRQGFDEAALLWKAVKATSGNILEIGRNKAGSTVLLAAASAGRTIYSIDIRLKNNPRCDDYLKSPQNKDRVQVLVADSRQPLAGVKCGFLFIDGDHGFEGVLADVVAHWDALEEVDGKPGLAAFHDALPNDNFKWRDEDRRLKRFWTRLKNRFRSQQKPEVAQDYSVGVDRVCRALVDQKLAEEWGAASSMLVLRKLANLPTDFGKLSQRPAG
jgi:predicted O-methyltransferase YrrM